MLLSKSDQKLSDEYLNQGFIVRPVADVEALTWMRNQFIQLIADNVGVESGDRHEDVLNKIHLKVSAPELNALRLKIIHSINAIKEFRHMYFRIARPYLEALVGNELAMQLRINLSIQLPGDDSSLLPVHADTWSGDSPFEVVVWLPFVDCYLTKAMYLLQTNFADELSQKFSDRAGRSSEDLYQSIRDDVKQIPVGYGEVLIFNQGLPHGNRINEENETRWSMNCRFKGIFTPYGDKKIGEFFEPITLRAASQAGMMYKLPNAL